MKIIRRRVMPWSRNDVIQIIPAIMWQDRGRVKTITFAFWKWQTAVQIVLDWKKWYLKEMRSEK